jgi:hypothetical protein
MTISTYSPEEPDCKNVPHVAYRPAASGNSMNMPEESPFNTAFFPALTAPPAKTRATPVIFQLRNFGLSQ